VLHRLMALHMPAQLATMTAGQRAEVEAAYRAIRRASAASSASGTAEPDLVEEGSPSTHDHEVDVASLADMFDVTTRQARKMAARWALEGRARKVGQAWLVDRLVAETELDQRRRRSA
jgi:hypothetical protein